MVSYTVIQATKEQIQSLLEKHLKDYNFCGIRISKIRSTSFSYDTEDNIRFVTLHTKTDKRISYQLRNNIPCFVKFTGFNNNIRYDIPTPPPNSEMFRLLQIHGIAAQAKFWKGGNI